MKRYRATDSTQAFEKTPAAETDAERYRLRLFVTGTTPKSARAIQNIRRLCESKLAGRYELEVIDIYLHPEQATAEQIVVTPTLIKRLPLPNRRMVGDLSDSERVLGGLGFAGRPIPRKVPENNHGN